LSLEELRKKIELKAKGVHVSILSESNIAKVGSWITIPTYDLNRILSGSIFRSIPSKTHMLLVGPEASFKSSCMCIMMAEAQKKGYMPVILDTEGMWTDEFVKRWGLDPTKMLYIYTPWIDDILVTLAQIIDSDDKKLIIGIDSIGGIDKFKMIEDGLKGDVKADQGTLQREIKRMLKMLVNICKNKDSIALSAGHLYGNPGYGAPEEIGGGKYLRLSADIILSLKKSKIEDGEKNVIGNEIKAVTLKNRLYPPYQEAIIEIDYRSGINKTGGLLDMALELGLMTKGGAWFTFVATGEKAQGSIAASKLLEDKEALKKIDEWLSTTGYSTVNENVKKAQELMRKISEEDKKTDSGIDIVDDIEIEEGIEKKKLKTAKTKRKINVK
jgi:recombination protein RecA